MMNISSIQIRPEGMYLAEEGSKDVEFPEEDRFRLSVYLGSRYKVCGDSLEKSEDLGNSSNETNALPPYHHWQVTPPWSAGFKKERTKTHNPVPPMQPTSSSSSSKKVNYENYFKRTIPLVTLGLDPSGKNVGIETTDDNIYIRVLECEVSAQSIVEQACKKMKTQEELVLLDAKWIPVSEGKGRQLYHMYVD